MQTDVNDDPPSQPGGSSDCSRARYYQTVSVSALLAEKRDAETYAGDDFLVPSVFLHQLLEQLSSSSALVFRATVYM